MHLDEGGSGQYLTTLILPQCSICEGGPRSRNELMHHSKIGMEAKLGDLRKRPSDPCG